MGRRGEVLPIEHGSDYANASRCRKRAEGPCTPCRLVHNDYHTQRRKNDAEARAKQAAYNLARTRAWARLQRLHPAQFAGLMDQELRRVREEAA